MTSPVLFVTETETVTALRTLLLDLVPQGVEIVQGQDNRVPLPVAATFIILTQASRARLATNVETYDRDLGRIGIAKSTQVGYQLDTYGAEAADICQIVSTLWRSELACGLVDAEVFQPLYATDGHQMPLVTGEKQYLNRWTQTVYLQLTPRISTPQDFADKVTVDLVEIP